MNTDLYDIDNSFFTINNVKQIIKKINNHYNNDKIKKIENNNESLVKLIIVLKESLSKYEYLMDNSIRPTIKIKHDRYLMKAAEVARNSNLYSHRHGCVLVYNDNIVSEGYNRKDSRFKKYSVHAEEDAINKLPKIYKSKKIMREIKLYVVRVSNLLNNEENFYDDELRMSKPCMHCANKIIKAGINTVYYSVDNKYYIDLIYGQIMQNF